MKNIYKILGIIVLAVFFIGNTPNVDAAAYDWAILQRDGFDSDFATMTVPTRTTSTPAVLGGQINGDSAIWYYFGPCFTNTASTTHVMVGRQIGLDLSCFSEITQIFQLIDVLTAGKVSTTTYSEDASSLQVQFQDVYNSLSALGSSTVQSDWLVSSTTAPDYIKNKPDISFTQLQSDWAQSSTTAVDFIKSKPTLATSTVAFTGSYTDLLNKPQIGVAYEGTTLRTGVIDVYKNATVASGTAIFHLTSDGTASGTALFPNGIIEDSIDVEVNDATASYQMSYALSNGNKTLTVTANKLTTANILTGILGQASANGSVVRLMVSGY